MRQICMSGSMSGVWKRSHGRTSEAPPDERGGNRYVRPTATAPHSDSTISIASILAGLWSRIRRHREIHRIKAAWGMIDDRTLEDIGVSRYEIEYARDARYRR